MKLVSLAGGWWSWWKIGEKLVNLVKSWWHVGEVREKLVKHGWFWWKVGEVGEKLVNLVGGWSNCGEKLVELEKNWWKDRQVGEKLVKSWWKVGEKLKLVKFGGGLVKLVKSWSRWWNCEMGELLKNPWHLSTPDTSVQRWGKHHIVFDHYRMVK